MKFLSVLSLAFLVPLIKAASVEIKPDTIKSLTDSGTWLIEYFSPICQHCINFDPDWKRLSDDLSTLETESNFHFGTVNCLLYGDLCYEHKVKGFPTLRLWHNGENIDEYKGKNFYEPVTEYVYDKIKSLKSTTESNKEEEEEEVTEEEDETDESEAAEEQEEEEGDETDLMLPNPEGTSINLNEAKLREIAKGSVSWFIKFYAPWCGHCKALAPTWVELASQLRNQVNIGEVNCEVLPSVCKEFGVTGFPTLQMFQQGEAIKYTGSRSLSSLLEFVNEHSGPSVKDVTAEELSKYLTLKDVSIIYVHKGDVPELIKSVANQYVSTIPFYASKDKKVLSKFDLDSSSIPALLLVKDNSHYLYPATYDFTKNTKSNRDSLIDWIEKEQYPLISKLGPANHKSILQGNSVVVLSIIASHDTVNQLKFRDVATNWYKSDNSKGKNVIFAEMDRSMWRDYVLNEFNIDNDDTARVIIYSPSNYQYYSNDLSQNQFVMDEPEKLYASLNQLNQLYGVSTLAVHERIYVSTSNGFRWLAKHWFLSMIGFTILSSFIYRYLTFHGPTRLTKGVLPSYRPVDTHKD
ncbi:thioredoxin-like protein [Helicostylum pulchrum]|nr:thioredoxin-like protein [Helicostylum pulchrum]